MTRVSFLITFSGDTISFNREVSIKEENILNKRYNKHLILTLLEERRTGTWQNDKRHLWRRYSVAVNQVMMNVNVINTFVKGIDFAYILASIRIW